VTLSVEIWVLLLAVRKLLVLLVLLVVAAAAGDLWLRNFASDRIAARLATSLDLDSEPEVDIGGFPFLLGALRGRFESISISGVGLTRDGVELREVELTLENVRVAVTDALTNLDKVRVGGGRGAALLSREEIESELEAAGIPAGEAPLPTEGELSLEGASLVLGPHNLPLPLVTDEMVWERARIVDGDVELSFRLGRTRLDL
jgi:hypothetical protein